MWLRGRMWLQAGGIFIPKEKNDVCIGQFQPISLLNVEGHIFFSAVAWRMVSYLKANSLRDISVQKAGIWMFRTELHDSGCGVVFVDPVNAFRLVPHSLLWKAFSYF